MSGPGSGSSPGGPGGEPRPPLWLRAVARVVPAGLRDAWLREWHAEVEVWMRRRVGRGGRPGFRRMGPAVDALEDAVRLRLSRPGSGPWTQDLRFALRTLFRSPLFTTVAVVTLGLGIGANAAIFSVLREVLLRPLPYVDPDALVHVRTSFRGPEAEHPIEVSEPEFLELRAESDAFRDLAAFWTGEVNLGGVEQPVRVPVASVSADFLPVLGVDVPLGRGFADGEDRPGAERVVVLTPELWRSAFGSAPDVLGRTVLLDERPATVVGVLGEDFEFPGPPVRLLRPNVIDPGNPEGRSSHYLELIGRLAPGIDPEEARERVRALTARWTAAFPDRHGPDPEEHPYVIRSLEHRLVGDVRPALTLLGVAVVGLLLVACSNVAGLYLVRGETRRVEMGVRTALGAARGRLARQLLTESMVLGAFGGIVGIGVALLGLEALGPLVAEELPRVRSLGLDAPTLLFAGGLALLTGLLFGVLPAREAGRRDPSDVLASGGRGATDSHRRRLVRGGLVVGQIALAVVLVVSAGLLIRSLQHVRSVSRGFEAENVLTLDLSLPSAAYPEASDVTAFYERLEGALEAQPGVTAAGSIRVLPLRGSGFWETIRILGRPAPEEGDPGWSVRYQVATPGFFDALGVPVVAGRGLEASDQAGSVPVAVVNEAAAARLWPEGDPVGSEVQMGFFPDNPNPVLRVVGVVGDVRQEALEVDPDPQLFVPRAQSGAIYGGLGLRAATLVVRASVPPETLVGRVVALVREMDPGLPVANVQTMERVVARSVAERNLLGRLMTVFSAVALVLGAVGIYGIMGQSVARRTREIGLRVALGAGRGEVVGMVLRQGARLVGLGVILGIAGAAAAGRLLRSFLYGVSPLDPGIFVASTALLAVAALLAVWVPARRAAGVDPMSAMRVE